MKFILRASTAAMLCIGTVAIVSTAAQAGYDDGGNAAFWRDRSAVQAPEAAPAADDVPNTARAYYQDNGASPRRAVTSKRMHRDF